MNQDNQPMTDEEQTIRGLSDLAAVGAAAYVRAKASGTLGSMESEDAKDMCFSASARPDVMAAMTGVDPAAAGFIDQSSLYDQMMLEYAGARLADMSRSYEDERSAVPAAMKQSRRDSMFMYSRLTPEELGRMEFDAENGDDSALSAVIERFYLG